MDANGNKSSSISKPGGNRPLDRGRILEVTAACFSRHGYDGTTIRRIAQRRLYLSDAVMTHLTWNLRVRKIVCVTTRE